MDKFQKEDSSEKQSQRVRRNTIFQNGVATTDYVYQPKSDKEAPGKLVSKETKEFWKSMEKKRKTYPSNQPKSNNNISPETQKTIEEEEEEDNSPKEYEQQSSQKNLFTEKSHKWNHQTYLGHLYLYKENDEIDYLKKVSKFDGIFLTFKFLIECPILFLSSDKILIQLIIFQNLLGLVTWLPLLLFFNKKKQWKVISFWGYLRVVLSYLFIFYGTFCFFWTIWIFLENEAWGNHTNKERLWTLTKCLPFLNSTFLAIWILCTVIPYQRAITLLGKEIQEEDFIDEGNQSKDNFI